MFLELGFKTEVSFLYLMWVQAVIFDSRERDEATFASENEF